MTISDVYGFLLQIRRIEAEIQLRTMQRDELRSCLLPAGLRYDKDKVQTSPTDQLSEISVSVGVLDKEIDQLWLDKFQAINRVGAAIEQLTDNREQITLMGYYVSKMPIKRIAGILNYSVRQTYLFKQSGVQHLLPILESQHKLRN